MVAGNNSKTTFRNTNWGMSPNKVIEKEGKPTHKLDNGSLAYQISLFDIDTLLYYFFRENKLTEASYYFIEDYMTSYNLYIKDYEKIKDKLKSKYGEPDKFYKDYANDYVKNQGNDICLQLGYLEYYSKWETNKTKIVHSLYNTGDTGEYGQAEIAHLIYYESLEYQDLINKEKKQEIEEKL